MKNQELARIFERMADILEFQGESRFRINAYRKAARELEDLTEDVVQLAAEGSLRQIPGIGDAIAKKILEYLETGSIKKYEELRSHVSDAMIEMLEIPGLGPRTLAALHKTAGVDSMRKLERVLKEGSYEGIAGIGEKKAQNILKGVALYKERGTRMLLGEALPVAERICGQLGGSAGVSQVSTAGSLRRMKETIGDIDILAAGPDPSRVVEVFTNMPERREVLAAGDTKGGIIIDTGQQVDLRVVREGEFGAALQYFTGSKEHNVRLREHAKRKGLKVNEYGVFRGKSRVCGATEEEVYAALEMDWMPAELREDRGEVEAALAHDLPVLVEERDLRGDLHVHTDWSDGAASVEDIARAAKARGYRYVAITDHSRSLRIAGGLSAEDLARQQQEIRRVNECLRGIRVLSGVEVEIRADGSLDFSDEVLAGLDIVLAAVHSGFQQEADVITARLVGAMENPHVDVIAHPTGRLLHTREPYSVDINRVMEKAAETGTALEINAAPDRMDLDDLHCRKAKEMGVMLVIGSDAHRLEMLWWARLGVSVARRGWLGRDDVLNTLSLRQLQAWLRNKAARQ